MITKEITLTITAIKRKLRCFFFFIRLTRHGGRCRCEIPPQSLLFPVTANALAFPKTPSLGTSPSNMLKETFKYSKTEIFCRTLGIDPVNRFLDRSKYRRPLREAKEDGMIP
ncbi:hypothetical protein MtrunA17_Chr5g0419231 [Medicago truncatula]|uniref:Uncharacterized protein n=1 Tax=Medicago truncatula TaxID=3880 RepID=A0A396HVZ7_MEDTR|nr:hypothetical protein MtrunA17_Chr5g0419231 [Medicago truncatula]